jgi:SagB-type dehydrogenase family enzyme
MSQPHADRLRVVREYHERTKHGLDRPAASLGYMDWANQPDPFRTFSAAEQVSLPRPHDRETPTYDTLFRAPPTARPLDADLVARLFYYSLALSAWKQAPGTRPWSLRVNPSSGDLHPTEGYLITGPVPGLVDEPGLFHYAPFRHRLERRCRLSPGEWGALTDGLDEPCLLIGLASIYWREAWKYGERAFRYCHHDVGHAIGALTYAARTLGWAVALVDTVADQDLERLLGTHLQSGIEAEHAHCLLAVSPRDPGQARGSRTAGSAQEWEQRIPDATFIGTPNRLSHDHHEWAVIEAVSRATRREPGELSATGERRRHDEATPPGLLADRHRAAERIIRQRRSAVAMDGTTSLAGAVFYHMLHRTLPTQFPFAPLPWAARVSLVAFVHRVDGLEPGLYVLVREESHEGALRQSLSTELHWKTPEGCPRELALYCLLPGDARQAAKVISCQQDIAADGAFSLAMLADFDPSLTRQGAGFYPRLFWETGLIGQVLYLEAEAAGVRATGIGCFFDDAMHELLGITDHSWQSLYHFTVGGPVEDRRLKTIPAYAHLSAQA